MTMTRIAEIIHGWLGWCPMAAAAQEKPQEERPAVPGERAEGAGPVAGRAVLFSRLTFAIVGIAWIVALATLPYLPEVIPIHWNIYGDADGFTTRLIGAFSFPVIITITAAFLVILPRFETIRATFDDSRDIYAIVIFATACLLLGLELTNLMSSAGMDVLPVAVVFNVLLGFFFMVIGSLMPYVRRNTTVGFRLPWTIRSERVWNETHCHGGPVFVIAGILIVLVSLIGGKGAMPLAFGILAGAVVYITVWSYRLSRREAHGGST
jgi:uncharacterized membrane protein